jgi:hypothetical protein
MLKDTSLHTSPQLALVEQQGVAVVLTPKQVISLFKKSEYSHIPFDTLKEVYQRGYKESLSEQAAFNRVNSFIYGGAAAELDEDLTEDGKGYKNPTGGLTQKGRDHYNRTTGSNLKAPVTTPPSKLKAGSKSANRRKSFCARMGGVEGPMKKPNGEPTRKALALRKWNCEETIYESNKTTGREDLHGKNSLEHHKQLKKSGYVSKGSGRTGSGTEHSYYHPKSNTMHVFRAKGGKINHAFEYTPNISYGKAHGAVVHEETITEKRGLWDNIHAKRERIKHGSGEHMRKPGAKGAPTSAALKNSQTKEDYTGTEKVSKNSDDASSRFVGTNSLTDVYKKSTPGYTNTIKRVVKEHCECIKQMKEDAKDKWNC